jgi:adenosylhomocysteine nucleosidase
VTRIVVATGTRREAAVLDARGWTVIAGGGDDAGLKQQLRDASVGASGILSFGMAGALSDTLAVGDWIVGERVTGTIEAACDPAWRDALAARLPGARVGAVFADGRMIASAAEKRALSARTGALAVDMESHVAARVAAERGLPFAAARCVSDAAAHDLPDAITVAMRPDGGIDAAAMLGSLLRAPGQVGRMVGMGWTFARAMRALKAGASRIEGTLARD